VTASGILNEGDGIFHTGVPTTVHGHNTQMSLVHGTAHEHMSDDKE